MSVFSKIRPATQSDLESIVRLLDLAFAPSRDESSLVKALVKSGCETYQWVMESGGSLSACACYSRAYHQERFIGFHLAPVAVQPDCQKRGLGSELIRQTLLQPPISSSSVFVVGEPSYYGRFGFRRVEQPTCPFNPSNSNFMALRYESHEAFLIGYEPEFTNEEPGASPERR